MQVVDVIVKLTLIIPLDEGRLGAGEEIVIAGVGLVKVVRVDIFTDSQQHVSVQVLDRNCDFRETVRQMRQVGLGRREWWR